MLRCRKCVTVPLCDVICCIHSYMCVLWTSKQSVWFVVLTSCSVSFQSLCPTSLSWSSATTSWQVSCSAVTPLSHYSATLHAHTDEVCVFDAEYLYSVLTGRLKTVLSSEDEYLSIDKNDVRQTWECVFHSVCCLPKLVNVTDFLICLTFLIGWLEWVLCRCHGDGSGALLALVNGDKIVENGWLWGATGGWGEKTSEQYFDVLKQRKGPSSVSLFG